MSTGRPIDFRYTHSDAYASRAAYFICAALSAEDSQSDNRTDGSFGSDRLRAVNVKFSSVFLPRGMNCEFGTSAISQTLVTVQPHWFFNFVESALTLRPTLQMDTFPNSSFSFEGNVKRTPLTMSRMSTQHVCDASCTNEMSCGETPAILVTTHSASSPRTIGSEPEVSKLASNVSRAASTARVSLASTTVIRSTGKVSSTPASCVKPNTFVRAGPSAAGLSIAIDTMGGMFRAR